MNMTDEVNIAKYTDMASDLTDKFYITGNVDEAFSNTITRTTAWRNFAKSWFDLQQDGYMADGGTYRSRRYAEFLVDPARQSVEVQPQVPYRQSKALNYLNGDVDRHYLSIAPETISNEVFCHILLECSRILAVKHPETLWRARIFQNRISAQRREPGSPTPEGIHRDGADYVLTILSDRQSVVGGESSMYSADGNTRLSSMLMRDPGDFILLDDRQTMHGVTNIECEKQADTGYRDVMVVMYTAE
ncbi:TPA: 2OG-Fe dioxygenase family protein [Salmonella enterica]|nr:2OG-Fe dioxygenase family protein [Salmonella enterica]HEA0268745.1 2OG-Fe dioxygenase family protein [Salmonella enterica]HEA0296158.1 2OG-Fe dioxygenase family protein [Salmonella enterica]HEA0305168.1 2OG-Fe dioxygenase family protein [Salmonella enterica]HEA0309920.1 2OG-Fe dioxygenase family protein [Salmonella enterica]